MQARAGRKPRWRRRARCRRQGGFAPVTLARSPDAQTGEGQPPRRFRAAAPLSSYDVAWTKCFEHAAFGCGNIEFVLYILVDGNEPAQRVSPSEKERNYRPRPFECRPRQEDFFIWIRRNPLKSPESTKEIQGNPSFFPWFYLDLLGFILPAACPGSRRRSRATAGLTSS
jgi:hypothetical protein